MNDDLGNKLRTLRKSRGLTTYELAEKISVSQSYISRFENNHAVPDIMLLEKILNALGTNLATFFSDDFDVITSDMLELIDTVKSLSPEARIKLNEFLQLVTK